MNAKICKICKTEKPVSEFGKWKNGKWHGLLTTCKECMRIYRKKHREMNKEVYAEYNKKYKNQKREYNKKYRKSHPDYQKNQHLIYTYGIDMEKHKKMYLEQNGCCAICENPIEYSGVRTDHNHKTGKVRGNKQGP